MKHGMMLVSGLVGSLWLFSPCARAGGLPVTEGLVLWLRGDAGVVANEAGEVNAWRDQSARERHVSAVNKAFLEDIDFGEGIRKPVVRVSPETHGLRTDERHAWGETLTAFVVFRFDAANGGANYARLLDTNASDRFILARIGSDYAFNIRRTGVSTGPWSGGWDIVEVFYDGTEGRLDLNGEPGLAGAASPPLASAIPLGIGGSGGGRKPDWRMVCRGDPL